MRIITFFKNLGKIRIALKIIKAGSEIAKLSQTFPGLSDTDKLRSWFIAILESSENVANLTTNTVDDEILSYAKQALKSDHLWKMVVHLITHYHADETKQGELVCQFGFASPAPGIQIAACGWLAATAEMFAKIKRGEK